MKTALYLLLFAGLLASLPAVGQELESAEPRCLTLQAAQGADYLTDALRLSTHQRRQLVPLITRQRQLPDQPLPASTWLRVLTLNQYQTWLLLNCRADELAARNQPLPSLAASRPQ